MGIHFLICALFAFLPMHSPSSSSAPLDHLPGSQGLFLTPTGITIESVYAANWETYVNGELAAGRIKWTAHFCTLPDECTGLFCDKNGPNNCNQAFDCTYCSNCPENN